MRQEDVWSLLPMTTEASCGCSHAGADPEERVTTGQLLLQSYYEDQDRAMRLGGLHHSSPTRWIGISCPKQCLCQS